MFETIIGLEVHCQLNTKTKIFCSCPTSFGDKANVHVCPTCLALPGALPVLNKEAVKKAIMFGTAVNATINKKSVFDRKNYFYPDLPKAYQISQFTIPIVEHGELFININGENKRIGITRAHLEEDAGKNTHEEGRSLVDLNRAGTPLLEIVSEPDMRSGDEAVAYLKKLHSILRFINISDANMQEGSFRCDVNVSIRPKGDEKLYTRVEIKNLNSFKFVQKAIEYEVARQIDAWEDGKYSELVVQETRLFDTSNFTTRSMRSKEDSAEYRYFPDPDLLTVEISDEMLEEARKIPELPNEKKERYINELGLKKDDAEVIISSYEHAKFFEDLINAGHEPKLCVTWLNVELNGRLKNGLTIEDSPIDSAKMSDLLSRIEDGTISQKAAKEVLDFIMENIEISVDDVIKKLGLKQVSDDATILAVIDAVISKNEQKVAEYRNGKDKLFGFFVGQVMKEGKGAFNPAKVNELLKQKL
ncbi:Asp-tRNA(Asn)/Glu-tRNA(Gln) amidotransferase subunit GatB [Campylobacter hominis]|uniref:Aspartyl/glutamyl-tRNA(Asn/Gln) amidotransferase subunit B n=1 Tax=Campylobacter hominis (strain ATCC BAA-381 / DSM 21671 / CCUG 45161 / LMG 19568 / NCTC 13146 / CH001A) TaxID=360107 RepID=GATB_CAMHC|nr:Asp-tRNA(Asn)/Glu-tRNA(Gln) amidotransferase subunit GatB [Campylobacter hominis]A7I1W4.1 RecName: Full=Aspartyl/glutamyl-tRNA(Asn/Gln) amidotransferase subunit B; Short=Asp/Glu-ADT subunit B [Campylobacter hominis ATCC BAA-381]ABS50951.1 aspartyl/glutamyl-tRNA(Asn/Gln) amidotransferase subunit B (Asp/Glu-ADT subunit B) [Campylobacter hominis ATCC BAA-381]UAK86211.1 Asp-tRNA(Asn)/Glu-tRNA(Gln) amidotransferase subunit GatB [Campylobacter hominis]SUW85036.1 aspartyl/glutamyl-tRNA amidotransfe